MQKLEGLLGLCCRAGQITLGAEMALKEIKAGRAALALVDESASEGTKKKIADACAYRHLPMHMLPADWPDGRSCKGRQALPATAIAADPIGRSDSIINQA